MQYCQDYDEILPCGNNMGNFGQGWAGEIYSYMKARGVFLCPNDPTVTTNTSVQVISYAKNTNLLKRTPSTVIFKPMGLSELTAPTLTVALFEVNGYQTNYSYSTETDSPVGSGLCSNSQTSPSTMADVVNIDCTTGGWASLMGAKAASPIGQIPGRGHTEGSIYLLADGHAKWLRPEKVSTGLITSWPLPVVTTSMGKYDATFNPT
jgi:hypothetical protein